VAAATSWTSQSYSHLRFEPSWLVLAVLGFGALELIQAMLWHMLLTALGARLDSRRSIAIWCRAALARYVPTSMLMLVLRISMSRARGVPTGISIASLVYEAVLAICGAVCIAAYYIVGLTALAGGTWRWAAIALPLAALLALHPRSIASIGKRLLSRLGSQSRPAAIPMRGLLGFVGAYALSFLLAGASFAALILAFYPLHLSAVLPAIGAFSIGFIASVLIFVAPGGIGVREATLVVALSPVMPSVSAAAVAVLARLAQICVELLLALFMPWFAQRHELRWSTVRPARAYSEGDTGG
jgi:uncharacterized membrane protein YbhN (UPF0104 family)